MPTIKIDLDSDTFRRLASLAIEQRRPLPWQAAVLIMQALDTYGGTEVPPSAPRRPPPEEASAPGYAATGTWISKD